MNQDLSDRDLRQRDVVPPQLLAACRATVVGVGAVGRQVALQLAAIGVARLQLVDFDTVEAVNLAPQGYFEDDVGKPKVEATAELCRRINSGVELDPVAGRFRRSLPGLGNVVFACVDSIDARRFIFEAVRDRANLFVDGRMSAETLRILTVATDAGAAHYVTTLFAPEEAFVGSCTARSTIYCANVCAGLMVSQFTRWLRRVPGIEPDIMLNLLGAEWSVPAMQPA